MELEHLWENESQCSEEDQSAVTDSLWEGEPQGKLLGRVAARASFGETTLVSRELPLVMGRLGASGALRASTGLPREQASRTWD